MTSGAQSNNTDFTSNPNDSQPTAVCRKRKGVLQTTESVEGKKQRKSA